MSFFTTSDGQAIKQEKEFTSGGGSFDLIPDGTEVIASIDEAKWDNNEYYGDYISLTWSILEPSNLKNRKVFQKLKLDAGHPKLKTSQVDKAKRMLAAIDTNCGGGLQSLDHAPQNADLSSHICHKPMMIQIMLYEIQGDNDVNRGNTVRAVAPVKPVEELAAPAPKRPAKSPNSGVNDDDLPF